MIGVAQCALLWKTLSLMTVANVANAVSKCLILLIGAP
jgi:hypothetical protein